MIFVYLLGVVLVAYAALFVYKTKTGSPYVPSGDEHIKRLMKYVKKGMDVADLGCGDGRVLIEAARHGAKRADGWEIEPWVWIDSRFRIHDSRMGNKVKTYFGDMWTADLSPYDLIFVYQLTRFAKRFREKILRECRPGTIVVANTYPIPGLPYPKTDRQLWVYEIGRK